MINKYFLAKMNIPAYLKKFLYRNSESEYEELPDGYTRVEYIESTGTQYINTGFNPNPTTTKVETTFQVTSVSQNNQRLFGTRAATNDVTRMCDVLWNTVTGRSRLRLDWTGSISLVGAQQTLNTDITLVCENNTVIENGTLYKSNTKKNTSYLGYPLYIGTLATNGDLISGNPNASSKWKTFKIYDNGTLVRDYVPCYRDSDEEAGLYDLITNTFYTNAGTGTFNVGPVVTKNIGGQKNG